MFSRAKPVPYTATAAVAMQQVSFAVSLMKMNAMDVPAKDVHDVEDLKLIPFKYMDLSEMMTLGGLGSCISLLRFLELNGTTASV